MSSLVLWIAQGFGTGRIPFAPGTFGSLAGVLWFGLLLMTGSMWLFALGTIGGLALSVWICGTGENILRQRDPGSIVFDEFAAIPLCFAGWVGIVLWQTGALPEFEYFLARDTWPLAVGVFIAFRIFDIAKPWPVRQSQALPGGWGVTVDDLLAALYVNVVVLAIHSGHWLLNRTS